MTTLVIAVFAYVKIQLGFSTHNSAFGNEMSKNMYFYEVVK